MSRKDYVAFIENLAIGLNTVNTGAWRSGSSALTPLELAVARATLQAAGRAFAQIAQTDPRFNARRFDKALCDALGIINSDPQLPL